jgi:hypothetical protein
LARASAPKINSRYFNTAGREVAYSMALNCRFPCVDRVEKNAFLLGE